MSSFLIMYVINMSTYTTICWHWRLTAFPKSSEALASYFGILSKDRLWGLWCSYLICLMDTMPFERSGMSTTVVFRHSIKRFQTFVVSLVLVRRRRLLVVNNVGNDAFTLDVASCCARRAGSLLVTALCNSTNYDFRQPFLNSGSVASSD